VEGREFHTAEAVIWNYKCAA